MTTLVLNCDARPVCLSPLSVIHWHEAIKYMVLDKVDVVAWYDDWVVHSAAWSTPVPAVIMLKDYHIPKFQAPLTKKNVLLRDGYKCQYCGCAVTDHSGTVDHVYPQSLGGASSWTNLVAACKPCNSKKDDRTDIKPKKPPHVPTSWELGEKRRLQGYELLHPSWAEYIQPALAHS